ncbi:hypothetical protein [Pseudokineococcus sp. 1T1Z-3]|uniref:hypothetical protein n=1 Tax=Pseudokineococcus sp. 1T1Z-3 TaxID=3132745 RepID=UPI0030A1601E
MSRRPGTLPPPEEGRAPGGSPAPAPAQGPSREAARAAKDRLAPSLADDPRVNGVGVVRWRSAYAVRVSVVTQEDLPEVPAEVDGVPVRVAAVGRVVATPAPLPGTTAGPL